MFDDLFYQINRGEIFVKTQCMEHEVVLMNFFRSCLKNLGYSTLDPSGRVWKRDNRTVVVCFADDFSVCGARLDQRPAIWFDSSTVIITDNHITVPTRYQVLELPTSYFGIFSYVPEQDHYAPDRQFHFSVNRLNFQRELIFLELIRQAGGLDQLLRNNYVNFNAWDSYGANQNQDNLKDNFKKYWDQSTKTYENIYGATINQLIEQIPVRNHSKSVEQANLQAWLVPVVETYSGNTTMAFSEKIFRALQTPVPWTVYSATGAVNYLKSLNFDVLDDIVDHSYNLVVQDSPHGHAKITAFISSSIKNAQQLQKMNFEQLKSRCQQAAKHNQSLLADLRQQWPSQFAEWLPNTINKLL